MLAFSLAIISKENSLKKYFLKTIPSYSYSITPIFPVTTFGGYFVFYIYTCTDLPVVGCRLVGKLEARREVYCKYFDSLLILSLNIFETRKLSPPFLFEFFFCAYILLCRYDL